MLFVEVTSVEKNCQVIVNLEKVVEIAPLIQGGCALFLTDSAGMNSRSAIIVKENYDQFKQFAMQTVSAEDIQKRFPTKASKKPELTVKPQEEGKGVEIDVPTFGASK